MTQDDDVKRAELARLGIARTGIARVGAARVGYVPTAEQILSRLLVEVADIRKRLERVEAAQATRKPKLQKGQQLTTAKKQADAAEFARLVDDQIAKSYEGNLDEAIDAVLEKLGVRMRQSKKVKKIVVKPFSRLTPPQLRSARNTAKKRYYYGKAILAIR